MDYSYAGIKFGYIPLRRPTDREEEMNNRFYHAVNPLTGSAIFIKLDSIIAILFDGDYCYIEYGLTTNMPVRKEDGENILKRLDIEKALL